MAGVSQQELASAEKTVDKERRRAELVVGSLQHYDGQKKIKHMNV